MKRELCATSEAEQAELGGCLARALSGGGVVFLRGDLGAGKTTLVRGFLHALGHKGRVKSPTYTLVEPYDVAGRHCYHLDLYRLGDPEELEFIGLRDLLAPESVLLVEWPERGQGMLPPADIVIRIAFEHGGRRLTLEASSARGEALLKALEAC